MLVDNTKVLLSTHCKKRLQILEAIIVQKKQPTYYIDFSVAINIRQILVNNVKIIYSTNSKERRQTLVAIITQKRQPV